MPKTPFVWKAELAAPPTAPSAPNSATSLTTPYSRDGHPAFVEARGMRGGLKRLALGNYVKLEQAKQACERHYRGGCDLSNAERIREDRPASPSGPAIAHA